MTTGTKRGPGSGADAWAEDYARKGYVFSGDDTTREPEPDTFNGLWGPQQRVHLVNQAVLEADRAARRFTVSGTDELPTEYVLTLGHDAAIVLPECFAPRIEDPEADPEDPGSAETPRSSGWGRAGAAIGGGSDEENPERLDGLWTAAAADRALQWLADHGWEVECLLTGTEHDGWYRRCWGRVAFYLARKVEPAGDEYAPVFHKGGPAHWPGDKGAWPHLGSRR